MWFFPFSVSLSLSLWKHTQASEQQFSGQIACAWKLPALNVVSFAIKCFYELKYLRMLQACVEPALPIVLYLQLSLCVDASLSESRKQKDGIKEAVSQCIANPVNWQQEPWPWAAFKEACAADGMTLLLVKFPPPPDIPEYFSFSLWHQGKQKAHEEL